MNKIILADNMTVLPTMESGSVDLIYIDPPFNTGKKQQRTQIKTIRDDENGDRVGFQGKRYRTVKVGTMAFADEFDDFIEFLRPRLREAYRILKPNGSFFLHIDYREVHYCKILLDEIFGAGDKQAGRRHFMNEIIWSYDYGARSKSRWSAKHDNILWYVKDPDNYTFNFDAMDRIPYMAPGLVGPEKAARGKTLTDVWWHTIVPTAGKERTGYPTQKPLGILERIIKVHTNPGDVVLDFFAGSGTTGIAAAQLGRGFILIEKDPSAMGLLRKRLARVPAVEKVLRSERPGKNSVLSKSRGNRRIRPEAPPDGKKMTVIAVGVSDYACLEPLRGPKYDLEMIRETFSSTSDLGFVEDRHIKCLPNATCQEMKDALSDYVDSRTAQGDILVLYFSGHGCVLGSGEFGFCLSDSRLIPNRRGINPLTAIPFHEIIQLIKLVDVHPIIIVDACYSGLTAFERSFPIANLQRSVNDELKLSGESYALLCACSSEQTAEDGQGKGGSLFTELLYKTCLAGIGKKPQKTRPFLQIEEVSEILEEECTKHGISPMPKPHMGASFPNVPFCRNTKYKSATRIGITRQFVGFIKYLYEKGSPFEAENEELRKVLPVGVYPNKPKLGYGPWMLIEKSPLIKGPRLTQRGVAFYKGEVAIPRYIQKNNATGTYEAVPGCAMVKIAEFQE